MSTFTYKISSIWSIQIFFDNFLFSSKFVRIEIFNIISFIIKESAPLMEV